MKKTLLVAGVLLANSAFAQLYTPSGTTNSTTNPSTDNVGVGIGAPPSKLTVYYNGAADSNQFEIRTGHVRNPDRYFMKNIIAGSGTDDMTFYLRHDGQMFVDGNLGLGTQNPQAMLHVSKGNLNNQNLITGKFVATGSTGGSNIVTIGYHNNANLELNSGYATTGFRYGNYIDLNIENDNSVNTNFGAINFINSQKIQMSIQPNGNIGIGTSSPNQKLDILGNILAGGTHATEGINALSIRYSDGSLNNWGSLYNSGATYMSYGAKVDNTNPNGWVSSTGTLGLHKIAIALDDSGIRFLASAQQQIALNSPVVMNSVMNISPNGNAALQGKFEAKEVKVTLTPTADFVFAEDYALPKLEDIEKHIKEKKHLPEIASAKVMEKEGVNVGEFQIKLLQKIEELTLYSIEQNKQIKKLQEENKTLQSQSEKIKKLEKQLEQLLSNQK